MKHIVCYSGGHSSALVAIEVSRKFGRENVILLNHDINPNVENADIKRFKREVAEYLGIEITFANIKGITNPNDLPDQFDVTQAADAFKVGDGSELCTSRLKTEPFRKYLKDNFPTGDCVIYYGFDANERARIQRRVGILGSMGYKSDYPLALWKDRSIFSTSEIGITPPNTYEHFKHANCFAGDTKFITDKGVVSLEESLGKVVNVITRGGWKQATVNNFGKQDIIELTLSNASRKEVVRTTANHRWIVPKYNHKSFGYTEKFTLELKVGDIIPTIYCLPDITPSRVGIQHGFTLGDGSVYQTSDFGVGKFKSRVYVAEGKEDVLPYFDNEMTVKRHIHGLPVEYKSLPHPTESKEYILGFVVGLIASDGCVSKSGIMISNKERYNLLTLKEMLNSIGIVCWVSEEKTRSTNYKQNAVLSHLTIPKKSFKMEWLIRNFHKERYGCKFTEPKGWKVESIVFTGIKENVFCAVVDDPIYKEFALDGNILTGNCIGCLKAGRQHWYIVYCTRKDIWEKAKQAEDDIGYTIIKGISLEELEPMFEKMQKANVTPTEHVVHQTFWKQARQKVRDLPEEIEGDNKPCECVF